MQTERWNKRAIQLAQLQTNAIASMQGGTYLCRICGIAVTDQEGNTDPRCATMCEPCNDEAVMEVYHQDGEHKDQPVAECPMCTFVAEVAQCTSDYTYFAESTRDGETARCPVCNSNDRIYRTWMTKEIKWFDNTTPADPEMVAFLEEN